jgi:hypothetical protein
MYNFLEKDRRFCRDPFISVPGNLDGPTDSPTKDMFKMLRKGMTEEKDANQGYISHFEFPGQLSTHQNLEFKVTTKDSKKPEENDRLLIRIAFN